jgi:hypothetical protein
VWFVCVCDAVVVAVVALGSLVNSAGAPLRAAFLLSHRCVGVQPNKMKKKKG